MHGGESQIKCGSARFEPAVSTELLLEDNTKPEGMSKLAKNVN